MQSFILGKHSALFRCEDAASTSSHSCHAIKVAVPLDGARIHVEWAHTTTVHRNPVAVAADVSHRMWVDGPGITYLIEPEQVGPELLQGEAVFRELYGRESQRLNGLSADLAQESSLRLKGISAMLRALNAGAPPPLDRRVLHAMQVLSIDPDASLLTLARGASPYHLSRLFRREVGITMRQWKQWRRLLDAFRHVIHTRSLIDATYQAGFCDQAHFSRSCRQRIGRAPADMFLRNSVQASLTSTP